MEASPRTERIGSTIDAVPDGIPYTLGVRIGGSGGTEVWVGQAPGGAVVAVKLVRDADRSPLDSFKHELEAAQALDHPAIVRVVDFGESPRGLYVAMDLVQPGISLANLIARHAQRRTPLSPAIVAYIGISVAEALDHAATRARLEGLSVRLLHRHLSPGNVLLDTEGRVRLVDLGVPASRVAVSPVTGALVRGTPGYLAPEHVREGTVDERSDVFVLGTLLHECATLEPVFARGDPNAAMAAVLEKDVQPLANVLSAFPSVLSRSIARAMSRNPADRPADAGELKVVLREAVPTTPGYTEARVALAGLVAAVLRVLNQESEARTALIDDSPASAQTLQLDAHGIDPPAPEAALANAERSHDSGDEPTGALLVRPLTARSANEVASPSDATPVSSSEGQPITDGSGSEAAVDLPPAVAHRDGAARGSRLSSPVEGAPRRPTRSASGGSGWLFTLSSVLEDPAQRRPIVVAFAVVCVALVVVLMSTRTTQVHDDALRAMYARGEYREAEAYYVAHVSEFRFPAPAFELAADAYRRARGEPSTPSREEEAPRRAGTAARTASAGVAAGARAGGAAEARALGSFAVPADIPESPARTKAEKKARARARKSRETALRALEIDDAVAAEKALRRCVATFDGPACRLHLGLLHARAGELEEASIHFERYLQAWPEAPDAAAIRGALAALPSSAERMITWFIAFSLAVPGAIPERDKSGLPHLRSESVLVRLVEGDREILAKNPDQQRPIASVTKLLSALVLAEVAPQILTATVAITIDEADKDRLKFSRSYIRIGKSYPACELFRAALSASDNRAICALARTSGLERSTFVEHMNAKALALGMTRSRFVDPAGLDQANVSTARDLLRLVAEAATHADVTSAGLVSPVSLVDSGGGTLLLGNTNRLARSARWKVLLGKTGYTIEAGRALVLRVDVDGHVVDMVFIGAREMQSVFGDAGRVRRWLLDTQQLAVKSGTPGSANR